jgi:hypothetical protein
LVAAIVENKRRPPRDLPARVNCSLLIIFFGETKVPIITLMKIKMITISKEKVKVLPSHGRDGVNLT